MSNFTEVADLDCSETISLGGTNKKSGKRNPTEIEGYYIGARQVASPKSKTGFSALHIFQTEKGNVGVWGKTNLDQKLGSVKLGTMTRATFVGMVETKNNPMYKYKVAVDNTNTIEVGGAADDTAYTSTTEDTAAEGEYEETEDYSPEPEQLPPPRALRPPVPAKAADTANQSKVKALLNGRRS